MKILILNGSLRKNGNTDHILRLIAAGLAREAARQGEPVEIESLDLGRRKIGFCRGCRICFDRGEECCPLKDDLLAVKAKVQAADGILMASPVYVSDVSGVVKNWIDRMAHVCHRPEFAQKLVFLVATTGSSPTGHTLKTMQGAWLSWGAHLAGQAGFKMGARMPVDEIETRYGDRCAKIARKFYQDLRSRAYRKPGFASLMTFHIQQRSWATADPDTLDYRYWRRQGWTDLEREFFIPHQANPLVTTLARAVGSLLALFWA